MSSLMLHFGITRALLTASKAAAQLGLPFTGCLQQNQLHDSNEAQTLPFSQILK
jgi:hypothetical protein